ncbi:ribbon-helix-helix protein, CopG family [Pelistega sp. MC2]|uniref:ribbon-helix-helix protein, CopG family n=1 Tax=Pelistega sp. MC2 TaxID=1720297 RepID=UPI00115F824F|nr:ribbon-helix-helix protein, CopG family [Pelistega sp. MC2]
MKHTTKPPINTSKKETMHVITFRLNTAEYQRVLKRARKEKRSISQMVRVLLAEEANV